MAMQDAQHTSGFLIVASKKKKKKKACELQEGWSLLLTVQFLQVVSRISSVWMNAMHDSVKQPQLYRMGCVWWCSFKWWRTFEAIYRVLFERRLHYAIPPTQVLPMFGMFLCC